MKAKEDEEAIREAEENYRKEWDDVQVRAQKKMNLDKVTSEHGYKRFIQSQNKQSTSSLSGTM